MRNVIDNRPLSKIKISPCPLHVILPWKLPNLISLHPFNVCHRNNLAPVVFQQLFAAHNVNYNNYMDIFTDDSKSGDNIGCGSFLKRCLF